MAPSCPFVPLRAENGRCRPRVVVPGRGCEAAAAGRRRDGPGRERHHERPHVVLEVGVVAQERVRHPGGRNGQLRRTVCPHQDDAGGVRSSHRRCRRCAHPGFHGSLHCGDVLEHLVGIVEAIGGDDQQLVRAGEGLREGSGLVEVAVAHLDASSGRLTGVNGRQRRLTHRVSGRASAGRRPSRTGPLRRSPRSSRGSPRAGSATSAVGLVDCPSPRQRKSIQCPCGVHPRANGSSIVATGPFVMS